MLIFFRCDHGVVVMLKNENMNILTYVNIFIFIKIKINKIER